MGVYNKQNVARMDARVLANAARAPRKGPGGVGMFKVDIFGDAELNALFGSMGYSQQRNVLIAAFRKSAKPMVLAMRTGSASLARRRTGNLFTSIGVYAPRQETTLLVGARKFSPYAGFHAHLVEAGTKDRSYFTDAGVEHKTGKVKPTYFFAKAVQQTKQQVVDSFMDNRVRSFHDYVIRYNKKHKT